MTAPVIEHNYRVLQAKVAELRNERDALRGACCLALGQLRFAKAWHEEHGIHTGQFDLAIAECVAATSKKTAIE